MRVKINKGTKNEKDIGEWLPKKNKYIKKVKGSIHLFRKWNAWGVDGKFFNEVLKPNNAIIWVQDKENKVWYKTKAEVYDEKGQWLHFKEKDEDHRSQIFLALKHFEKMK